MSQLVIADAIVSGTYGNKIQIGPATVENPTGGDGDIANVKYVTDSIAAIVPQPYIVTPVQYSVAWDLPCYNPQPDNYAMTSAWLYDYSDRYMLVVDATVSEYLYTATVTNSMDISATIAGGNVEDWMDYRVISHLGPASVSFWRMDAGAPNYCVFRAHLTLHKEDGQMNPLIIKTCFFEKLYTQGLEANYEQLRYIPPTVTPGGAVYMRGCATFIWPKWRN